MTPFSEGAVIGDRYRLVTRLGSGAMGEVWRAEHVSLRSPVALKLIDPALLQSGKEREREDLFARFEREAQAAARLQSAHVVRVSDHGFDRGVPYIAMELLEGETLAQRLEREGRLTPQATLRVITHLGRAMSKAHEVGIVHRDLKPENVFLVKSDDEEIAKVLDFGIAKLTRSPLDLSTRATATGQLLGTPCYMSPEQASGSSSIDHRSDLWAMAVIAFECLTGRLPFLSTNIGDLVLSICARPLPVPSQVDPSLPPGFDAFWSRGAAREPDARFGSARELADALRAVLSGEPESVASDAQTSQRSARAEARTALSIEGSRSQLETQSGITTSRPEGPTTTSRSRLYLAMGAAVSVIAGASFLGYRVVTDAATSSSAVASETAEPPAAARSTSSRPAPEISPGVAPDPAIGASAAPSSTVVSAAPPVPTSTPASPGTSASKVAGTNRPPQRPPQPQPKPTQAATDPRLGL